MYIIKDNARIAAKEVSNSNYPQNALQILTLYVIENT